MKAYQWRILFIGLWSICLWLGGRAEAGQQILYIDSYHQGYGWSDGITEGIQTTLAGTGVELEIFRMDSKRQPDKGHIRKAAIQAKMRIEALKPDLVIASDDNASKYLIAPFYKNAKLPVIFCGLNWDASVYGYPYQNATGMVEVALVPQLLEYLKPLADGKKLAYLAADVMTARKEGLHYRQRFDLEMIERYVKDFSQWKKQYKSLQSECDILIVGNHAGINDWEDAAAMAHIQSRTQVPTGALYDFMAPYALISYVKLPQEQGCWAAQTALKVLNGADIRQVPITRNKEGRLIVNLQLAQQLAIAIPTKTRDAADHCIE